MSMNIKVGAKYKLQVLKDGVVTKESAWSKNTLTNVGLSHVATHGGIDALVFDSNNATNRNERVTRIKVGTGSTTPDPGQTSLDNEIGSVTLASSSDYSVTADGQDYDTWRETRVGTWDFGLGAVVGNVSEVGLFTYNSSVMFSRALVRDGSGNPTTITVLEDELLKVVYTLTFYIRPTGIVTGTIGGYSYQLWPIDFNGAKGFLKGRGWGFSQFANCFISDSEPATIGDPLMAAGSLPANRITVGVVDVGVSRSYDSATRTLRASYVFSPSQGNDLGSAGIKSMTFTRVTYMDYCAVFTPAILKDDLSQLTIDISVPFDINFDPGA